MRPTRGASIAPRTSVEKTLAEIWTRILGLEQVGISDDFVTLGGDSLAAAQVVVEIQEVFGQALPMATLLERPTIASLAQILSRQVDLSGASLLVGLQRQGSTPPFFCVHPVGGEVFCYADLARQLAPDWPFYGIRSAEPDGAGRAVRMEALAARYLEAIRDLQPEGPYYLGGYSFGGSVALEMAQQLRARGESVALLAILDHTPPPTRYQSALWRPTFVLEFCWNLPYWLVDDLVHAGVSKVWIGIRRKARTLRRRIWSMVDRPRATSASTEAESQFDFTRIPMQFRKLLEAHYQALQDYSPRVYPGRVTLFKARTRPLFQLHGYDLGWSKLAGGGLEVVQIPGNHETILKEPHVAFLGRRLRTALLRAPTAT